MTATAKLVLWQGGGDEVDWGLELVRKSQVGTVGIVVEEMLERAGVSKLRRVSWRVEATLFNLAGRENISG